MQRIIELYRKYRELIRYGFWGVMTTLVNYVVYFGCTKLAGIDYLVSNVAAWCVAVIFAFLVNKVFVFQAKAWDVKALLWEFGSFVSARILSGVMETGLLWLFVEQLHCSDAVIKIVAGVLVIIINYVFSKLIIFRKKEEKKG